MQKYEFNFYCIKVYCLIIKHKVKSKKHIYCIFYIFFCILLISNTALSQSSTEKFDKVVIDAGHGGIKPGAIGSHSKEKDITLAVALKVGQLINENLKSVKVYYTRVIDQDVDLYKRSTVANKINADLFISIHCNSSTAKNSIGTETFAMGLAKTNQNLAVAKKENSEILTEANRELNYQGFDLNSPENDILLSLYQNAYLSNSLEFANMIQKEYIKNTSMKSRGVKQANLVVLWKSSMPAVLTEIGFISNSQEEAYISSDIGQWTIASSIFRAIIEYKNKSDNMSLPVPEINSLIPKDVLEKERIRKENERLANIKEQQQLAEEKRQRELQEQEEQQQRQEETKDESAEVIYRVQFSSSLKQISISDNRFNGLEDMYSYQENGKWKYASGLFATQSEALEYLKKVKETYNDAFVVAFYKGKRISIVEAKRLSNKKTES